MLDTSIRGSIQRKPKFHLSIGQNSQIRERKEHHPEYENPAPLGYSIRPITNNERYSIVFVGEDLDFASNE
jgi:hypothetical protein